LLERILFLIIECLKKLSRTGAVLLIIAATLLVYWPALRNGFVWDDTALVLRDPLIRSWRLIPEGFRHFLFLDATASNFYRPIQRLTFVADYQLYGFDHPWGWHLTSILVHAGAAVALFFAIEKLLAMAVERFEPATCQRIALGVALLWEIHPLATSAVTYVAGRADPLAALFGFTGLALGLESISTPGRRPPWMLGAAGCFLLAMLSKESGAMFLPLWLLIVAWRRETRRYLVSWVIIALLVAGAYSGLRFTAEKVSPPKSPPSPAAVRPILAARAFAEYADLLIAPVTLRMERDVSTHPMENPEATLRWARLREYQTLAGVLLLLGFALWFRSALRRAPTAALLLAAFILAYLPISNALPLNATVAEHWLYVPGAFLFAAAFVTLTDIKKQRPAFFSPFMSGALGIIFLCWMILLGARTAARQADWRDQRTFIQSTIDAGGNSPRMLMNLANVDLADGDQKDALALYQEALRRAPDQAIIWFSYASVLARAHDIPGAREALSHAEKSDFLAPEILHLRSILDSVELGRDPGDLLRQAVTLAPSDWETRKHYLKYLQQGQPQEALRELSAFIEQHPFRADSWRMLAKMLEELHQPAVAAQAWREAALRDVRDEESRAAWQRLAGAK
jgi:tetratricopeptide (TPR) repeat protein